MAKKQNSYASFLLRLDRFRVFFWAVFVLALIVTFVFFVYTWMLQTTAHGEAGPALGLVVYTVFLPVLFIAPYVLVLGGVSGICLALLSFQLKRRLLFVALSIAMVAFGAWYFVVIQ